MWRKDKKKAPLLKTEGHNIWEINLGFIILSTQPDQTVDTEGGVNFSPLSPDNILL